ncbi:formyltetrahydrofolate deformylase [Leptospira sp. GIMC2001]|uniref:formyltetrahydrofolate deformylase n=1 Tax=Leptospira sp. GIMC2001 TaxID=1513297 RepID=UPI00234AC9C4|nr:formyltetrahydrofolate deformylase [Leptospira sp. GIMC2001]WCL51187.1 formyltetrahydrofolate deformylase [Leptospira sp. GIMC2001]
MTEQQSLIENQVHVLWVQCNDKPGLIHAITAYLLAAEANIISNQEYVEPLDQIFFLRAEFQIKDSKQEIISEIKNCLSKSLPDQSIIEIDRLKKQKAVILASKEAHCLGDILLRSRFQEVNLEVLSVVANHKILEELTNDFHIPFIHISNENRERNIVESEIDEVLRKLNPDLIILAKYMRILSAEFTKKWAGKILNIHHSFLPAFVGAKPYTQAYLRGVKIIGATAHFVTSELDEGPIISQDVIPVNHAYSPEKLAMFGKDLERNVLARAVRLVIEKRVMVYKNRTIVFE